MDRCQTPQHQAPLHRYRLETIIIVLLISNKHPRSDHPLRNDFIFCATENPLRTKICHGKIRAEKSERKNPYAKIRAEKSRRDNPYGKIRAEKSVRKNPYDQLGKKMEITNVF